MKVFASILNVLCSLLALLISFAMLLLLIVTPITCSALDVVDPDKLTKIVTDILTQSTASPAPSSPTDPSAGSSSSSSNDAFSSLASGGMGAELKDYILGEYGEYVTEETLNDILNSNAVQEVLGSYAEDVTNALVGKTEEPPKFTPDNIKQIVDNNMDEIVDILQEVSPELAEKDREEIKSTIQTAVNDNVDQIVDTLPKPAEVKDAVVAEMPELEIALDILAHRDEIKLTLWGAIVVLALLVFALRLFRISGLGWISTCLFIASAINGLLCFSLKLVPGSMASNPEMDSAGSIIGALLNPLFSSMLTYTLILLGVAVVCLVAHIFIQKVIKSHRAKRLATQDNLSIPEGTVLTTTCVTEDIFVGTPVAEDASATENTATVE